MEHLTKLTWPDDLSTSTVCVMVRAFALGAEVMVSILKTLKMVLVATFLGTQNYKASIGFSFSNKI